jgi:hypothetical protein
MPAAIGREQLIRGKKDEIEAKRRDDGKVTPRLMRDV